MVILIDAYKAVDKFNNLSKVGIEGIFLNLIMYDYQKSW